MLIWKKSAPGTIREENQDTLEAIADQGMLILADGSGSAGLEAGRQFAADLRPRIEHVRLQASIEQSAARLTRALRETREQFDRWRAGRPDGQQVSVRAAFACVVEGQLFLGTSGPCGVMARAGDSLVRLEPLEFRSFRHADQRNNAPHERFLTDAEAIRVEGPLPLRAGDWVLLASEGILLSQGFAEMEDLLPLIDTDAEETAERLFQRASARYDGDDRSLALARFQARDLRSQLSDDVPIETEIDRTFTVPVWAAGLLCALIAAFSIFLHRLGLLNWDEEG